MYRWPFRRKVRLLWWLLCTLVLASVPYTIWEFKENGYSAKYAGWTLSGVFVLLTIPVTVYQVALHVAYYNEPALQRHVVRILMMVPIYALVSWWSLRFNKCRRWLTPLRECYEAVVLYSFISYLVGCLQLKTGDYRAWLEDLPPQSPIWPMSGAVGEIVGVRTIQSGQEFMYKMRQGVLAYVVVRPTLAFIQVVCMLMHTWGEDEFTLRKGWLWCMLINNVTQAWAVYCLIAMYKATSNELVDIHPLRKFIIIKMVVFFSFWQGFLLSILGGFNLIGSESVATYDTKALAGSVQDVLICVECLPASLAFAVAFPARDYMHPGEQPGTILENIVNMFDVRDLGHDMSELVENQVTYASAIAAQGVVEAASAAHGVYRAPVDAVAKPMRSLARTYWNNGTMPVVLSSREPGHAMQPLLDAAPRTDGMSSD